VNFKQSFSIMHVLQNVGAQREVEQRRRLINFFDIQFEIHVGSEKICGLVGTKSLGLEIPPDG